MPSAPFVKSKLSFMHVGPGLVRPSYEYLKDLMKRKHPTQRLCIIMFDELKLQELCEYDVKLDAALGPHSYANCIYIKGLNDEWQMPIYNVFDSAISKFELLNLIQQLEAIDVMVVGMTCDQGPRNQGLVKELGISLSKTWFTNPFNQTRRIYFTYDWIHLLKSLRNWILDGTLTFKVGRKTVKTTKKDLIDLWKRLDSEGSVGFKLKPIHFTCR